MIKNIGLFSLIFFICQLSYADQTQLFSLYRTNYFTEKTMIYSVDVDRNRCLFESKPKFDVYFVKTGTNQRLSEFSNQNKKEFGVKSIRVSSDSKTIVFSAGAFDRVSKESGKNLSLEVVATGNGKNCQLQTNLYSGSKKVLNQLKRIEVEFKLVNYPLVSGLHPGGIIWMGVEGSGSLCLIGNCP